ncbi:hypothetical protein BerOc1_01088 [Pseudodesulfovibrio hydrargyri]|uniref:Right handed beta helix domain-containing protein n=1 Tax=Pseudodesulfovibrio hydrargyri TaxID=2125990 RepID=A0A1J5MTH0_9BACT|nr:hypothetical protein [Pseudodesulfovibrio hydrargyri]OIQ49164.1 hypothetical protein BerOc1_01088 [Pseudodesulfovibrio hydrargyri]
MYRFLFPLLAVLCLVSPPCSFAQAESHVRFITYEEAAAKLGLTDYRYETGKQDKVVELTEPGVLDKGHTTYVLQNDVSAAKTAFVIKATDVTLDLNGHVVEYGTAGKSRCYGVTNDGYHRNNLVVANGTIRQSSAMDEKDSNLAESSPIHFAQGVDRVVLAGLTLEYHSPQTSGMFLPWSPGEIHHNVIRDKGHVVINRHQSVAAINAARANNLNVHSNFVERVRQSGIFPGLLKTTCKGNIVNIDSVASNSFGIGYYGVKEGWDTWVCEDNIIRGKGVHPVGIGVVHNAAKGIIRNNDVEAMVTAWNDEYNQPIGGACYRTTWGADKILVENNRFVYYGAPDSVRGKDSWGRTIWVAIEKGQSIVFKNNVITGVSEGGGSKVPAIGVTGHNKSSGLVFINNKVASSWANVMLADYYGEAGGYPRFIDNDFIRLKDYKDYYTIRSDANYRISTGVFMDNRYEDGASMDSTRLELSGKGVKDVLFMRPCAIQVRNGENSVPGARVVLKDKTGATVAEGATDEAGRFEARLLDHRITNRPDQAPEGIYMKTIDEAAPYTVTVESDKGAANATIDKGTGLAVTVDLGG